MRSATLDQLIAELPEEDDWIWNSATGSLVLDPIAAELRDRLARGVQLSDDQWRAALLRSRAVQFRERWAAYHTFYVSMRIPAWLGASQIRIEPRNPGLRSAEFGSPYLSGCGICLLEGDEQDPHRPLGTLPAGEYNLTFDVALERNKSGLPQGTLRGSPKDPSLIWKGPIQVRTVMVAPMADVIPPVSGSHLDRVIQLSTSLEVRTVWVVCSDSDSGRKVATLVLEIPRTAARLLSSTALSLQIEVLKGGEVLEEHELFGVCPDEQRNCHARSGTAEPFRLEVDLLSISSQLESLASNPECWIRIRGTDRNVTKSFDAKAWWKGEVTIPISAVIQRS